MDFSLRRTKRRSPETQNEDANEIGAMAVDRLPNADLGSASSESRCVNCWSKGGWQGWQSRESTIDICRYSVLFIFSEVKMAVTMSDWSSFLTLRPDVMQSPTGEMYVQHGECQAWKHA